MFVATNRIRVRKPHGTDLEELFQQRGGLEQQAGFVGFQLWKSQGEAEHEEYLVVSHWDTKDAHDHAQIDPTPDCPCLIVSSRRSRLSAQRKNEDSFPK